jgi:predicted phosphodiesterase
MIKMSPHWEQQIEGAKEQVGTTKIAVFSDIHANLPALEAVIKKCQHIGVDQYLCLGDIATLGGSPAECVDMVRSLACPVVQGNHELYLLGKGVRPDWETCPSCTGLHITNTLIGNERKNYLANLPFQHDLPASTFGSTIAVHASPHSQFLGFKPDDRDDLVRDLMGTVDDTILLVAHTHIQFVRQWSRSLIVNVGSVGMPLDGSPHADFSIATFRKGSWSFELMQVEYDWRHSLSLLKASDLWKYGGDVTKIFAYQTCTGNHEAEHYFRAWIALAQQRGCSMGEVCGEMRLPAVVNHFFSINV